MLVGCVRLRHIATDMVVSFNAPVEISSSSSSAETVDEEAAKAAADGTEAMIALMHRIFETANILDYSLFGG